MKMKVNISIFLEGLFSGLILLLSNILLSEPPVAISLLLLWPHLYCYLLLSLYLYCYYDHSSCGHGSSVWRTIHLIFSQNLKQDAWWNNKSHDNSSQLRIFLRKFKPFLNYFFKCQTKLGHIISKIKFSRRQKNITSITGIRNKTTYFNSS